MLTRFDHWIIAQAERFCHSVQRWTGKTNFFLAGLTSLLLATLIVTPLFNKAFGQSLDSFDEFFLSFASRWTVPYLLLVFIYLRIGLYDWIKQEDKAFERLQNGIANPKKNDWLDRIFRVGYVIMMPLPTLCALVHPRWLRDLPIFPDLPMRVVWCAWAIALNTIFEACDPLPPCQGKFRQWLAALFMQPATEAAAIDRP